MAILQNQTFDEIIFEHRNKDYGAYQLRKNYQSAIQKSMFIGVSIFLGLTITTMIFANQSSNKDSLEGIEIDLLAIKEKEPPKVQPKEEKLPEPQKPQTRTVEHEIIVPVDDDLDIVESPSPTLDDLAVSTIGTENRSGLPDDGMIFSEPPAETPTTESIITEIADKNTVFTSVEVSPTYSGGMQEMYHFLSKNINYPTNAQRNGIEGKVVLSFIIEKDGSISGVEVLKGLGFGCDEEATRVVKMMPNWNAGKQNGNPVRVKFTIPVFYKLDN